MNLYGFTTEHSEDGARIVRASGCVADHRDPEQRKVSIAFQVEVDLPTVRNGAYLRRAVLEQVREVLDEQAKHFQQIGDQAQGSR